MKYFFIASFGKETEEIDLKKSVYLDIKLRLLFDSCKNSRTIIWRKLQGLRVVNNFWWYSLKYYFYTSFSMIPKKI